MRCLDLFHLFIVVLTIHVLILHALIVKPKADWSEVRAKLEQDTVTVLSSHPFNAFLAELQRYNKDYQLLELNIIGIDINGGIMTDKFPVSISLQGIDWPESAVFRRQAIDWLKSNLIGQKVIFQYFVLSGQEKPSGLFYRSARMSEFENLTLTPSVNEELLEMGLATVSDDALSPPLKASLDHFSFRGQANFQGMWCVDK